MKYEICYKPAFAAIFMTLKPGERITAEAGAMTSMDSRLTMKTQFSGGILVAFLRKFFGGESLFVNVFINETKDEGAFSLEPMAGLPKSRLQEHLLSITAI